MSPTKPFRMKKKEDVIYQIKRRDFYFGTVTSSSPNSLTLKLTQTSHKHYGQKNCDNILKVTG